MKKEEAEYYQGVIDSVNYDSNIFTIWYSKEKVIIGAFIQDNSKVNNFFNYASIYDTIIDTDRKIKFSLQEAIKLAENPSFEEWNPVQAPSFEEYTAIYYTENALFRIMILWDLLAQMFNIKAGIGKPFDKVYAAQIFHDAQQGKKSNPFAKKVYEYMIQNENTDVEPWEGNHTYLKDYRDKMTHRSSPNMTSFSDYSLELRLPVIYVLKRVVEDYKQVSDYIQEIVNDIVKDYRMLGNVNVEG